MLTVAVMWLVGGPTVGLAQNSADITAQANVLTPLTVTGQQDLDFGDVFPGLAGTVAVSDVAAGRWLTTGSSGAEVQLSFTLPANLVSGGNNLPISFGANSAGYNTANLASAATTFDPAAGAVADLGVAPAELYVWIGGTVTPAVTQPQGLYTGTINLTVNYTGN
jgi:hypothetical protein